jgi:hypothetical protein
MRNFADWGAIRISAFPQAALCSNPSRRPLRMGDTDAGARILIPTFDELNSE